MSFTPEEYEKIRDGAQKSAAAVVPYIVDLIEPETVCDVGGGEGWWGIEFKRHECQVVVLDETVEEMDAVDVDVGVMVPGEIHRRHVRLDTNDPQMIPIPPSGRYDLAVCLEVAEHLDEEWAVPLVNRLCQIAPVVLFSAAIPGQGGLGHVNEQWPAYWAQGFIANGYVVSGALRWIFWDREDVEPWYRQNLLICAEADSALVRDNQFFSGAANPKTPHWPHPLVHPDIWGWRIAERDQALQLADGFTWTGP